jgi:hypothetical protein
MGDQSALIPEKLTSELGRIIWEDEGRSMRAVKGHLLIDGEGVDGPVGRAQLSQGRPAF